MRPWEDTPCVRLQGEMLRAQFTGSLENVQFGRYFYGCKFAGGMDSTQVTEIQKIKLDFEKIEAAGDDFANRFYTHLFDIDPELKNHFKDVDMSSQGTMVLQAVRIALDGLKNLGERHVNYGVQPKQYDVAVSAFVRALKETLGESFNAESKNAWTEVLETITSVMKVGAENQVDRKSLKGRAYHAGDAAADSADSYVAQFMTQDAGSRHDLYADAQAQDLPKSFSIEYIGEKVAEAAPLQTILDISLQNNIPHICVCGALGRCSTCRVVVVEGFENCLPKN
jgi:hemoglobin-like flavoprotein/ferredoxin